MVQYGYTLTKLLSQNPSFVDGLNAFQRKGKSVIYGLSGSQKSFLLNQAFTTGLTKPVVIVVHDKDHKEMWERDLAFSCLMFQSSHFLLQIM